jgi:hypothetical protein
VEPAGAGRGREVAACRGEAERWGGGDAVSGRKRPASGWRVGGAAGAGQSWGDRFERGAKEAGRGGRRPDSSRTATSGGRRGVSTAVGARRAWICGRAAATGRGERRASGEAAGGIKIGGEMKGRWELAPSRQIYMSCTRRCKFAPRDVVFYIFGRRRCKFF